MPRFAALDDDHDQEQARHVRGTALAVAQDWLVRLPDGPLKDLAIDALEEAARLARAACAGG
jgi:hypothetical protein